LRGHTFSLNILGASKWVDVPSLAPYFCTHTLFLSLGRKEFFYIKGGRMFEVTALAVSNLKAYLEQNKISSAIRIALMQGG
jgi:hypothetical protein